MLSAELVSQIRLIELRARHLATESLVGEYQSAFRGQGLEFDEVREYMPGDDVRSIDWHVTARMQQPFVKVYREERQRTLMLLVDVSPSLQFTTQGRQKQEIAAEVAAVLAFLAIRNQDKVGLITFSDHVEHFVPARKGRGHIWQLIRTILEFKGKGKGTRIDLALDYFLQVQKSSRHNMCFLLSDFLASGHEQKMAQVARRHELIAVRVQDPFEHRLPAIGAWGLSDKEAGGKQIAPLFSRLFSSRHLEQQQREREASEHFFRQHGIDWFDMPTNGELVPTLLNFMRRREKRQARAGR